MIYDHMSQLAAGIPEKDKKVVIKVIHSCPRK